MVAAAALVAVLTCLDRVFLGVHYPSDVTAGLILGVGLVLASYAGYLDWNPPTDETVDDPDTHGKTR
jgi:undecaprenyl-diphosphatase